MSERKTQESKLEEYELFDGFEYYNPATGRRNKRTAKNRRKIYNQIIDEERKIENRKKFQGTINPDMDVWLPNMVDQLLKLKGKTVTLQWNDQINKTFTVPANPTQIRKSLEIFRSGSDITVFHVYQNVNGVSYEEIPKVAVYIVNNVENNKTPQKFREGIDHCVFEPIKQWATNTIDRCKTNSSKKKYNAIYNKCIKLENEYKNGVPEDDIQKICDILQIELNITLPLVNQSYISHRCNKKPLKIFNFINTRLNHVDLGSVVNNTNTTTLDTYEELLDMKNKFDRDNTYYVYTKGHENITSLTTLHDRYVVQNEYQQIRDRFELDNNISTYKLDDIDDKDLSIFVNEGTHYNETIDFKPPNYGFTYHIDQEKAYYNFWICKYYNGLLGKITDFRKCDKMIKDDKGYIPALYRIYNLNFDSCKHYKLINKLNCYKNYNVYPSCELDFLLDIGVTFSINEGCWGVNRIDFRFPEEFKNKENKVSYYARYVGSCDSHILDKRIWLKGDRQYFENVQSYTSETIQYDDELKEGCITYKKQHNYHFGHLTAFITALQRINCIEQMMRFNYNQLVRVCVDGIYYEGEDPPLINLFRLKNDYNFNNIAGDQYCSGIIDYEEYDEYLPEFKENFNEELHAGAGGTGKTHKILTDKGLQKVLYIAPSYKLASDKNKEYGINATCWEQLVCKDPNIWRKYLRFYNTLVFDEVSMMSKQQLKIIRNRFKTCKVIFCGDIGFQLPCFNDEDVEIHDFKNITYYDKNYRVKCAKLGKLLKTLRDNMENWDGKQHLKYIFENYSDNVIAKVEGYNIEDYILTYTNKLKDKYTDMFKDTFEKEKYIFKERYDKYFNGSIDILPKNNDIKGKKEIRHAFTVHSVQGITVKSKLFIDISLFDSAYDGKLLYTAVSRAKYLNQIYFVRSNI